jgi:hypothetical protein
MLLTMAGAGKGDGQLHDEPGAQRHADAEFTLATDVEITDFR